MPSFTFTFENPLASLFALPLLAMLAYFARGLWQRGCSCSRIAALVVLRGTAIALLLLLVARPVWVESQTAREDRHEVVLLIDRSESMSLQDAGGMRYQDAVAFARDRLAPALAAAKVKPLPYLFAEQAIAADGAAIAAAVPDGRATNLGGAIVQTTATVTTPPLAVIALTDGATTDTTDHARAISLLVENRIPLIGVGFGSEIGARLLSIERVEAPSVVAPRQPFHVAAHLRATGTGTLPDFELALLRDGQIADTRKLTGIVGPRLWQTSFEITEESEAFHTYTVQLFPPADPAIKCPTVEAAAGVRITDERQMRVLFVQGGLTWDYKFIRLALLDDPGLKLSGLSRTASNGAFVQSVDNETDLVGGFPATLDALTAFRVVILANLRPADLTTSQQELLAEFCSKLGGGVLLMGGASTFNASWKESRLEQLLPVRFAALPGRSGGGFRLRLTDDALVHPVFQISSSGDSRTAWTTLPSFSEFAAVEAVKPAAQIWMHHPAASTPRDMPLMVVQRYGSGMSAVICVQNFWRWRLARESNVEHFDRFWRQLLRHLGEGGRDRVLLVVPDQPLQPGAEIRVVAEQRVDPAQPAGATTDYTFRVQDEQGRSVADQQMQLRSGKTVELTFRGDQPGVFKAAVYDERGVIAATRSIELRDVAVEFLHTSRNQENLKQWAQLSGGVAVKAEECQNVQELIEHIQAARQSTRRIPRRQPAGVNGGVLLCLLGSLCGEWFLRKRWGLT